MTLVDFLSRLLEADKDVVTYIILLVIFLGGYSLIRSSGKSDVVQNDTIKALATSITSINQAMDQAHKVTRATLHRKIKEFQSDFNQAREELKAFIEKQERSNKEVEVRLTAIEARLQTQQLLSVTPTGTGEVPLVKSD